MKMKQWIWVLVIVALVALFGTRAWYLYRQSEQDKDAIKIGAILPLSAFDPDLVIRNLYGIQHAEKNLNASGMFGNKKIKFLIEDGKHEAKSTLAAFNKLVGAGVQAFLIFGDAPTSFVKARIEEEKIPVINIFSSDTSLVKHSPYIFGTGIPNELSVAKMVKFLAQDQQLHRIGIVKIKNNYGEDNVKALKRLLTPDVGRIVCEEGLKYEDLDARTAVERCLSKNPDVILLWSFGSSQISALRRLKEAHFSGQILSDFTFKNKSVYTSLPKNGAGIYYTMVDFHLKKAPGLIEKLKQKDKEPDLSAALGYGTVELLAQAIKTQGTTPEQIRKGLLNIQNFDTVLGQVSYDADGQIVLNDIVLMEQLSDGTAKIIKE